MFVSFWPSPLLWDTNGSDDILDCFRNPTVSRTTRKACTCQMHAERNQSMPTAHHKERMRDLEISASARRETSAANAALVRAVAAAILVEA